MAEIALQGAHGTMPVYLAAPDGVGPWPGVVIIHVANGGVPGDALEVFEGACPIVGSYGARDRGLRKDPGRMRSALERLGIAHDIKVYPEAAHSFLNDHDRAGVPSWAVAIDKLSFSHSGFHEASADDARRRVVRFFDARLKSPLGEEEDPAASAET